MVLLIIIAILIVAAVIIVGNAANRAKSEQWDASEQDPSNLEGK